MTRPAPGARARNGRHRGWLPTAVRAWRLPVPVALRMTLPVALPMALFVALLGIGVGTGCGARAAGGAAGVAPDDAIIQLRCNVPEAELWVNERYIGPVGALKGGVALSPGTHRVEARHAQHHAFYAELELRARERRTLDVDLAPRLP